MAKVSNYRELMRFNYDYHQALKWRYQDNLCVRLIGYQEIDVAMVPDVWFKAMMKALVRGYATTDSAPWYYLLELIIEARPVEHDFRLSYVGRTKLKVYLPPTVNGSDIRDELNTLWSLERTEGMPKRPFCFSGGENEVYANIRKEGGKGVAPKAMLVRAARAVEQQLAKLKHHRQPLIDYMRDKPILRLPFASHDKNWVFRT